MAILDLLSFVAEDTLYLIVGEWTTITTSEKNIAQDLSERKVICGASMLLLNRYFRHVDHSDDCSVVV